MSRLHLRGGDVSINFSSSEGDARDSGSLLDGMGSASSLASTSSSVFSTNAQANRSNGHLASATPLTHPDSSPMKSPFPGATSECPSGGVAAVSPIVSASAETPRGPSENASRRQSPLLPHRRQARPPPGEPKGYRAVWDPEIELSKEERKKSKVKIRAFGTEVRQG